MARFLDPLRDMASCMSGQPNLWQGGFTQALAETAMLAVSGLAYTLATLLKLDNYIGYFLPLPVIIAAMRSGPAVARKTMTATCFLLLREPSPLCCNIILCTFVARCSEAVCTFSSPGFVRHDQLCAFSPVLALTLGIPRNSLSAVLSIALVIAVLSGGMRALQIARMPEGSNR